MKAKCIEKIRDKNNHIIGYTIIGNDKKPIPVKSEKLKEVIRSGQLEVVNLTLTSDNRLIDKKPDTPSKPVNTPSSKPNINVEATINKAKTLGYIINTFDTACGHKCYIASSPDDTKHILIIPDDVKYIYPDINFDLGDNAGWGWHEVYATNICKHMYEINGTLKVIGGKGLATTCGIFYGCRAQSLDLSSFNTSNVTDMRGMFKFCRTQSLDLTSFNTSNVECMYGMFNDCKAHSIDLSSFNTSNVIDMTGMFVRCEAQSLDLSSFNTSNVTTMNRMFWDCRARSIDLSSFDTSNVESMNSMFKFFRPQSIDLDLTSFNTSKVKDMSYMFQDCKTHSIDLTSFNTSNVEYMGCMFHDCKARVKVNNDPRMEFQSRHRR